MTSLEQHLMRHSESTLLGIDVGGTKLLIRAFNRAGVRQWRYPTGVEATPEAIEAAIQSVMEQTEAAGGGIAIPGLVQADGMIIDCDVLPALNGWNPLTSLNLQAVRNDGDAALETVSWQAGPQSTVAVVGSGTAIATAIQVGGRRLRSYRPCGGELGYVPFGRHGRIDDHAAGMFLIERLGLAPDAIHAALKAGQPSALEAIREAGEAFGIALLTVLHLIHPTHIGLYGGTLRYPGYLEAAMAVVQQRAHPALLPTCHISLVEDPDHVVADGVALAALQAASL